MSHEKTVDTERRKRINQIKKMIIYIAILFILIPIIMCFILFFKVNRLESQLKDLLVSVDSGELVIRKDDNGIRFVYAKEAVHEKVLDESSSNGSSEKKDTSDKEKDTKNKEEVKNKEDTSQTKEESNKNSDKKKEEKIAYLTFDDGPSERTDEILKVLKKKKVKATFFVVGKSDEQSMRAYKKIIDAGHTLAMHTYSHDYVYLYESLEHFKKDMKKLQDLLYDATGQIPTIFRFPGGSSTSKCDHIEEYIRYANEEGLTYFDWNVSAEDAVGEGSSAEQIKANVMKDALKYDTSVILFHDAQGKASTVEALPSIIDELKSNGYSLLAIDETVKPVQHVKADEIKSN